MFSARFATITAAISSNLGMDVLFFDSSDFLEIIPCVFDEVCWITAYATALVPIMLVSPNKWSSISLIFSWTLVIDPGISTYDGKPFSHFNHVFVISGGSSLSQGIFSSQILRKTSFATSVHGDINPKTSYIDASFCNIFRFVIFWIGGGISMLSLSFFLSHLIPNIFVSSDLTPNCCFA